MRPESDFRLAVNWKNSNDITIFWHDVIVKTFWRCFVFLVKFSYWSKFHVNIITGSGVITISFYKGLTRNPEIENPVWVSNKMLLNAEKCLGYSFYHFWKKKGGRGKIKLPFSQIRAKVSSWILSIWLFSSLLWNVHRSGQYPNWEKLNALIIKLRCAKFIQCVTLPGTFNFWEAFLHNEVTLSSKSNLSLNSMRSRTVSNSFIFNFHQYL